VASSCARAWQSKHKKKLGTHLVWEWYGRAYAELLQTLPRVVKCWSLLLCILCARVTCSAETTQIIRCDKHGDNTDAGVRSKGTITEPHRAVLG
jgi:hypothetical protein